METLTLIEIITFISAAVLAVTVLLSCITMLSDAEQHRVTKKVCHVRKH